MKVVNPVGRTVDTGVEAHFTIQPKACMCSSTGPAGQFATKRGSNDHCFHCGCGCGMSSDNEFTAKFTIRSSK